MTEVTSRPVIGVTVSRRTGWRVFPVIAFNLWLSGARALRWDRADQVDMDAVDGVVIGGGDDIAPTLYGGEMRVGVRLDPGRDAMERAVLEGAFSRNLPVLGICRGSQMINIVLGGSLDQDAYKTFNTPRHNTILPEKTVCLEDDSLLARVTGSAEPMKVNALHSQAVDRLGRGLRVAARDTSGMIQAVERVREPFALGVQWHPEYLFYRRRHRMLFAALASAARAARADRGQISAVLAENEPISG